MVWFDENYLISLMVFIKIPSDLDDDNGSELLEVFTFCWPAGRKLHSFAWVQGQKKLKNLKTYRFKKIISWFCLSV